MPLTPEEQNELDELDELEAELARAGGRGAELADDVDWLRRRRDLPCLPDEIQRRLAGEFDVYRAVNGRIALWSLLHAALLVRAEHAEAAFIAVEETDQNLSGSLVLEGVLDAGGARLDESAASADDEDLRSALSNLDETNGEIWGVFAVDDGTGRNVRLDVGRILDAVTPANVACSYPESFAVADDEEVLEVGFSYGLTGAEDWGAGAWYFAVQARVRDVAAALRAAVGEYLALPDANPNDESFNWGDAMSEVPDEVWARHGLRPLDFPVQRFLDVDHDETFAEPTEDGDV